MCVKTKDYATAARGVADFMRKSVRVCAVRVLTARVTRVFAGEHKNTDKLGGLRVKGVKRFAGNPPGPDGNVIRGFMNYQNVDGYNGKKQVRCVNK